MKTKKIGIYGGSFDPIHFGHINLAIDMMEAHTLDEIWFCPTAKNPFKPSSSALSDKHRLAMLKLGLEDLPQFSITEVDMNREGPSYTIDTLQLLIEKENEMKRHTAFFLILGFDTAINFHLWKDPTKILKLATVLVGARNLEPNTASGQKIVSFSGSEEVTSALKKGMTKTTIMEISSTEIRNRLKSKKYCGHLVPAKVLDYIFANGLY